MRRRPAAAVEAAAPILVGTTGTLVHAVNGQHHRRGQLHGHRSLRVVVDGQTPGRTETHRRPAKEAERASATSPSNEKSRRTDYGGNVAEPPALLHLAASVNIAPGRP